MSFQRIRASKNAAVILLRMCLWSAPAGAQFKTALERYTDAYAAGYLRRLGAEPAATDFLVFIDMKPEMLFEPLSIFGEL